jgi:hypothetical protein
MASRTDRRPVSRPGPTLRASPGPTCRAESHARSRRAAPLRGDARSRPEAFVHRTLISSPTKTRERGTERTRTVRSPRRTARGVPLERGRGPPRPSPVARTPVGDRNRNEAPVGRRTKSRHAVLSDYPHPPSQRRGNSGPCMKRSAVSASPSVSSSTTRNGLPRAAELRRQNSRGARRGQAKPTTAAVARRHLRGASQSSPVATTPVGDRNHGEARVAGSPSRIRLQSGFFVKAS